MSKIRKKTSAYTSGICSGSQIYAFFCRVVAVDGNRVSDVYDEETQRLLEISGGDEAFAKLPENHRFIIPTGCHWNNLRNATTDIGRAIYDAMRGIETANPETLRGIFTSFDDAKWTDKTKLTDSRLKDLIEHMSKIKVRIF